MTEEMGLAYKLFPKTEKLFVRIPIGQPQCMVFKFSWGFSKTDTYLLFFLIIIIVYYLTITQTIKDTVKQYYYYLYYYY